MSVVVTGLSYIILWKTKYLKCFGILFLRSFFVGCVHIFSSLSKTRATVDLIVLFNRGICSTIPLEGSTQYGLQGYRTVSGSVSTLCDTIYIVHNMTTWRSLRSMGHLGHEKIVKNRLHIFVRQWFQKMNKTLTEQ